MNHLLAGTALSIALITPSTEAAMKKRVTFASENQTLVGDLYLPGDYQAGDRLPGVIVSGSWTSVKEQMPGGYAARLADRGYAALAFDFRGWGESASGTPLNLKYVEHPREKTKDIIAAANYLSSRPEVDNTRLATLGVCASAGYAIDAAHQSPAIAAVAVVAPWLHDAEVVQEVYGESIPALLNASREAQASGQPVYLEAASDSNENAVMYQAVYYTDPKRGAIAEYDNKFSTLSWQPWLEYDAIKTAAEITKPLLLVHSEDAAIPQGAKKFAARGGENVELIMLDGVTQFEFYDNEADMRSALEKVDDHYRASFK